MPETQKIGYSYRRFSTAEQANGDSLRRQKDDTDRWCERNGVVLDTSMKIDDLATTGFTGLHRSNPDKFGLASFVQAVRDGKVAPDSYLVIENLDRLTREDVRTATRFVFELLDSKINIVTTSPEKVYLHDSKDMVDVIVMVVELARGHGESARKSERVGKAWKEKKTKAIEGKKALSKMCPHWLRVVEGRYVEIPERVALVRRIFKDTVDGVGVGALARKLNLEGIPPFRTKRRKGDEAKPHIWQKSSIARILGNRAVLGEYQEMTGHRERKVVGEPVEGFYPVIVTEGQFQAARLALKSRLKMGVVTRSEGNNLFTGLVRGEDEVPFVFHNKGKGKESMLAKSDGIYGAKPYYAMPYRIFEKLVLGTFREIVPSELVGEGDKRDEAERLSELQGNLIALDAKIADFEERIYDDPKNATWSKMLTRAQTEKEKVVASLQEARRTLAVPVVEGVSESRSLIAMLETSPTQELRVKLRSKLSSVVSEILVALDKANDGPFGKMGWIQVRFRNTGYHRNLIFVWIPARRSRNFFRPEYLSVELETQSLDADMRFDSSIFQRMKDKVEKFKVDAKAKLTKAIDAV